MTKLTEQQKLDLFKDAPEGYNCYMPDGDWYEAWFIIEGGMATQILVVGCNAAFNCSYNLHDLLNDGAIKRPEPKEETNMIYTQEMHDNGVLPSVGMKFIDSEDRNRGAMLCLFIHENQAVYKCDYQSYQSAAASECLPLPPVKTEFEIRKEKQVIDTAKELANEKRNTTIMTVSYRDFIPAAKYLQEKGMLAEINLNGKG
jgi:hypothetical protein